MSKVRLKVNKHFKYIHETWDFKIMLCIGSYGSGKSHEIFTKVALKSAIEKRKIMIVRKEFTTLKESCYADLEDAYERIGIYEKFNFTSSPLQIKRKGKNGTKIIFRGLDKVRKIKSIKDVDLIIVEEADEISIVELKELVNRLRTTKVKTHIIFMCNPVSRKSSIYKYFFCELGFDEEELYEKKLLIKEIKIDGTEDMKIVVHHSTYKHNNFLDPTFKYNLESELDPRIRRIACEGKFGIDGDLVLYNAVFENNVFERYVDGKIGKFDLYNGLDWGFSKSMVAGLMMAVNTELNELYVYWEHFTNKKVNYILIDELQPMRRGNILIYADNSRPEIIEEFRLAGYKIAGAAKGGGSVEYGEQKLRSFKRIVIDEQRCPTTKKEAEEYAYVKGPDGEIVPGKYTIDSHSKDSMVYGLHDFRFVPLKDRYKNMKYIGV